MRRALPVAALVLSFGGCTALLGVDGTYRFEPGEGGAGAGGGTASTASGDGGGGVVATGATASTGGGSGGGLPEPGCDLCRVDTIVLEGAQGQKPRIAQRADRFELVFHRPGSIELRDATGAREARPALNVVDAVLAAGTDPAPALAWIAAGDMGPFNLHVDLFAPGPSDDSVRRPPIDAIQIAGTVYVAGNADQAGPALLACGAAGCTHDLACPGYEPSGRNDLALARFEADAYFVRRCQGALVVTDLAGNAAWEAEPLDFDELAAAASDEGPVALTISGAGQVASRLRLYTADGASPDLVVDGAADPAVADLGDRVVGAFRRAEPASEGATTLGILDCPDRRDLASCALHDLVAVGPDGDLLPLAGASWPSVSVAGGEVWLAWEQDGVIHAGRLGD